MVSLQHITHRAISMAGVGALVAGLATGTALAAPQDFLPAEGGLAIKFVDFETSGLREGGQTFGIFNVTSLQDAGQTTTYWTDLSQPGATGNLTGRFDGLTQLGSISPSGDFQLTGGTLTIYNVPSGSFNPTAPPTTANQICPGGVCPSPWLVANFAPGIDPTNPLVTVSGNQSSTTSPFTGHSSGYLDVVGGTMASRLDSNIFTTAFGKHDLFLEVNFCTRGTGPACTFGTGNTWPIKSNDPVVGQLVPEPTSVLLFGSGMLGLGVWGHRRRRQGA
jgi:hypothetical protein